MTVYSPRFRVGDVMQGAGGRGSITVTQPLYDKVLVMRGLLIGAARGGEVLTYKALSVQLTDDLDAPAFDSNGDGYRQHAEALDLLSCDCIAKGEPSLASLVVREDTGLSGGGYVTGGSQLDRKADIEAQQQACWAHWGRLVTSEV